jgi:hypothetical protein
MSEIVIIKRILDLRLVHLQAHEAGVHVINEIVGMIFAARPFSEAERSLVGDGACRGALEHLLALYC